MEIYLTPSKTAELQACPFCFQQKYLKKTRLPRFVPNPSAQMGTNVHGALEIFYKRGAHSTQDVEELLGLLDQKWDNDGFNDPDEENEYHREARRLLQNYYADTVTEEPIRKRFTEKFHAVDHIKLGAHHLNLSGKLDRLDYLPDGSVEVVDYKTSSPTNGLPDRREMAESLSNLIYYRLVLDITKGNGSITVSHYYLRSRRKVSAAYTPEVLANAKNSLGLLLDHLNNGIAPSSTGHGCSWCLVRKTGQCPHFEKPEPEFSSSDF